MARELSMTPAAIRSREYRAAKQRKAAHQCGDTRRVTCGDCGRSWCESCDPCPSALCHWCHGRGHSTAELPKSVPTAVEQRLDTLVAAVPFPVRREVTTPQGLTLRMDGRGEWHPHDPIPLSPMVKAQPPMHEQEAARAWRIGAALVMAVGWIAGAVTLILR